MFSVRSLALLSLALSPLACSPCQAATNLPAPPAAVASKAKLELITRDTVEAVGLVAVPGEKVGRLFVVEKRGRIRILRGKQLDPQPFLDLSGRVALEPRENGEQGLLGLAFHPKFRSNGRFFVHFTDTKGDTRVLEMRVDRKNPNRADASFEKQLLWVDQPFRNHNAGHLVFGPDGKLYVLLGDGGSADDPKGNGQSDGTLLGKALRIDVDAPQIVPEVIGKGLRNPWRYDFDRKTGDLYIADVGQKLWEEVHVVPAGRLTGHNYGWNVMEGTRCFKTNSCASVGLTAPVAEFSHKEGCSITGGYVYRGKALPELDGIYFYSDYCTALLRGFRFRDGAAADHWDWKTTLDPESQLAKVAAFGEDQEGELYVVTHEGPIYKLVRR